MNVPQPCRVLVTGASGNLGTKLIAHLRRAAWCREAIGLDRLPPAGASGGRHVIADLADPADRRWRDALAGVDAVVHLAARHPYPDATWSDASASIDMTLHLVAAMRAAGVPRLVFASSNHVMGGYKEAGLAPGALRTDLPPWPGTRFRERSGGYQVSTPYAAAKLAGERIALAAAAAAAGAFSAVCVRIGWCRPGDNRPEDIRLELIPGADAGAAPDAESLNDLRWVRGMWLSNRDLPALVERAIRADAAAWPAPGIVVNGTSANAGMPWDADGARCWLGYVPLDDLYAQTEVQPA